MPTVDGLWTAEFGSNQGMFGGGVVIFRQGKLAGGDATHFYVGEYQMDGSNFHATVRIAPFIAGAESVFKTVGREFTLDLVGSFPDEKRAIAQGSVRGAPELTFGAKLVKREIPPEIVDNV